ncbi:MAG: hypothetical protein ACHQ3O_07505 [Candidatus Limnocylindria bacterium]|jgi:hypothetical protein
MRLRSTVVGVVACAALACASGPPRPQGTAGLPALAPDLGRLILYHTNGDDAAMFHPALSVDGEPVGDLPLGTFRYVDRAPGVHLIAIKKQPNVSAFGGQAPTRPVDVLLAPGETTYVRFDVEVTPVWIESSLTPMDPITAQSHLSTLRQADSGS